MKNKRHTVARVYYSDTVNTPLKKLAGILNKDVLPVESLSTVTLPNIAPSNI